MLNGSNFNHQEGESAMKTYTIWYDNGTGWYEYAGQYRASSESEALQMARCNGLAWADLVVSDTDPNRP